MIKLSRSPSAPVCLAALRYADGMMRRNISRIEAAKHRPTLEIMEKIAKALKVSFTDPFLSLDYALRFPLLVRRLVEAASELRKE